MADIAEAAVGEVLAPDGKLAVDRVTPEVTAAIAHRTAELLSAVMRRDTVTIPIDSQDVVDRLLAEYPRFYEQQEERRRRRDG